jgi:hypothetical protein
MSDLTDNRPNRLWKRGEIDSEGRQLWYSVERKRAALPRINPAEMLKQLSPAEQSQILILLKHRE